MMLLQCILCCVFNTDSKLSAGAFALLLQYLVFIGIIHPEDHTCITFCHYLSNCMNVVEKYLESKMFINHQLQINIQMGILLLLDSLTITKSKYTCPFGMFTFFPVLSLISFLVLPLHRYKLLLT